MKVLKSIWGLLLLVVLIIVAVASNELGYGFITLFLLLPIGLLMVKVFGVPSDQDQTGQK